jgi:hypothetical protein
MLCMRFLILLWYDAMTRNGGYPRLTVEELAADCLDVHEMYRAGLLKDRSVTLRPLLRWPKIETLRADRFVIQVNFCNQVVPQYIHITWTGCFYGGARPWFFCAHCRKRAARIFLGMGGYFCRGCLGNPAYESQLRNEKSRDYLRAYRLRERLGGSRPLDPIPPRPFRMWRRTYNRICAEIERLERPLLGSPIVKRAPLLIRPLPY